MKGIIILFAVGTAIAQPVTIAAGSSADQYYSAGSTPWLQAGAPAGFTTLRYAPGFSYTIPVQNGLYAVNLGFIEPNKSGAGQRVFTVTANGQQTAPIDLFKLAGQVNLPYAAPTIYAFVGAGFLTLQFAATAGNALVSTISVQPLLPPNTSWATLLTLLANYSLAGGPSGAITVNTTTVPYEIDINPAVVCMQSECDLGKRPWTACGGRGLGAGIPPPTAALPLIKGTYPPWASCYNDTGFNVTVTGVRCFTDNAGSSTLAITNNTLNGTGFAGTSILSVPLVCGPSYPAAPPSTLAVTTIAPGSWLNFTFTGDGNSAQTDWVVSGVY
jgi:hypothetical protein